LAHRQLEAEAVEHRSRLRDQVDERIATLDLVVRPVTGEVIGDQLLGGSQLAGPELVEPAAVELMRGHPPSQLLAGTVRARRRRASAR